LAIEARLAQAQGPSGPLSGQAQGPSGPLSGQAQGPSGPLSGPVQAVWSDDGIILRMPEADEPPDLDVVLVEPAELDDLVVGAVGSSALFAARFRENAARSLLLPRRRPGSRTPLWQLRQRASDLAGVASRYGEFPILLETYRECLRDAFDLPALGAVMAGVASRRIRVTCIDLAVPSPFASGLVSSWVAAFMYEGDAPLAERRAQALTLDRRMLAELLGSDELRDLLDAGALGDLEAELQALDDRRRARSIDQAADLLRRLGDLDAGELEARCTPEVGPGAAAALVAARRAVPVRVAGEERLIAAEDAGRYRDALGVEPPPGLPEAYLAVVPDALVQLVRRWARTHGPFVTTEPAARFGLAPAAAAAVLDELRAAGRLERGAFRPGGRQEEWCDGDVLAALRQRSLAALRSEVAPAPSTALVRFLPGWHGVAPAGRPPAAGGLDRLWEVVGQLQGLALPASVWEHDVLAVRVRGYQPRMLDELLSAGEVMWMGAGSLGRDDGRVVLARRADAAVLLPRLGLVGDLHRPTGGARSPAQAPETGAHQRIRQVLAAQGACFFRELRSPGVGDTEVLEALWDLVWAGEVTNDSWAAVRATVGARSRRGRGTRSQRGRGTRSQRALPSLIGGPGRVGPVSGGLGRIGPVSGGPGRIGPVIGGPGPSGALTRGPGPAAGGAGSEAGAAAGRVTPHGLGRRPRVGALSALGPARGQGRWSLVERQIGPVEAGGTQAGLAVAGLLLGRHGVVTRDVVRAEGLPGGFAGIYPVLKAMEESGRARRGYFVTGAGGAQFALPGAVERLRDSRSGAGDGVQPAGERGLDGAAGDRGGCGAAPGAARSGPVVTILAATDPANAYGLGVAWPVKGPQRVAGAYLVLVDGTGSLYLDKGGRGLTALREVDGTWEAPAADALAQSVRSGHWGRLALARYPEELEDALLAASFVPTPRGLVCYG
ncbi:MAG: DNA glycosylase AlkZ-like family protein, partial [Acidimicrobiales bacterium]